jgi:hypothetical protein
MATRRSRQLRERVTPSVALIARTTAGRASLHNVRSSGRDGLQAAACAPLRSYDTEQLPTPQEALQQPFRAFPSWFLRIECDRCGKVTTINEAHTTDRRGNLPLRMQIAQPVRPLK